MAKMQNTKIAITKKNIHLFCFKLSNFSLLSDLLFFLPQEHILMA